MEKINRGQLRVLTTSGAYTFGTPAIYNDKYPNPNKEALPSKADEIRAEITVVNDAFWVRMLLLSDLGFSEAYMVGDIEIDHLDEVFKVSQACDCDVLKHVNKVSFYSGWFVYFSGLGLVLAFHSQSRELGRTFDWDGWNSLLCIQCYRQY